MPPRALLAAWVLALAPGCLYIPPMHHTAGVESVRRIEPGTATRGDVVERLGRPNVLAKRDVYVYDWSKSYGYLVTMYSASDGEITGRHFHVVVYFDGERVARYAWDSHPSVALEGLAAPFWPQPVADPRPFEIPDAGVPGAACVVVGPALDRCLVACEHDAVPWIVARGREQGQLETDWTGHKDSTFWFSARLADDGRALAASRVGFTLHHGAWSLEDGRALPLSVDGREVVPLGFAPDSSAMAVRGRRGELIVLDTRDGHVLLRLRPFRKSPQSVSFAADRIALSTARGDLAVLDRTTGAVTARLASRKSVTNGRVVALSPDAHILAAASSTALELWDVATLESEQGGRSEESGTMDGAPTRALLRLELFPAADDGTPSVAFAPDGTLVVAGLGRHLMLVPAPTGPVRWMELPQDGLPGIQEARFSADGRAVYVRTRNAPAVFDVPDRGREDGP